MKLKITKSSVAIAALTIDEVVAIFKAANLVITDAAKLSTLSDVQIKALAAFMKSFNNQKEALAQFCDAFKN